MASHGRRGACSRRRCRAAGDEADRMLTDGASLVADYSRTALGLPLYDCSKCKLCFNYMFDSSLGWAWYGCRGDKCSEETRPSTPRRPTVHHLQPWDGMRLLQWMRGRTLAFAGDSLSQQHYMSFACMLLASPGVRSPQISRRTYMCDNHELHRITARWVEHNFTLSYTRVNTLMPSWASWRAGAEINKCLLNSRVLAPLHSDDVVILNWGVSSC